MSSELIQKGDQIVHYKFCFIMFELSDKFLQISRTILYEIITYRLGFQKVCAKWVTKQLIDIQWNSKIGHYLEISWIIWCKGEQSQQNDQRRDTGQLVNVETKEQSTQWIHNQLPKRPKYSNEHYWTKKRWLQSFEATKEFCLLNVWNQVP